jgi:tetratricopeptide (TPR) repeat protein
VHSVGSLRREPIKTSSVSGLIQIVVFGIAVFSGISSLAKDRTVNAVVYFEGPNGPAYTLVGELELNEKTEMYICTAGQTVDGNNYKKLNKIKLVDAVSIERDAAGVLTMTTRNGVFCVAPANLKLDKQAAYSPKDLADKLVMQGRLMGKSTNAPDGLPEFKPGSLMQFVINHDTELAEYARANRWNQAALWRNLVAQFPDGPHLAEAKQKLATLIMNEAAVEFAAFEKTTKDESPAFDRLRKAKVLTDDSLHVLPTFTGAQKMAFDIRAHLNSIATMGRAELGSYQKAVAEHTAGFQHLAAAKRHAQNALGVDPEVYFAQRLLNDANVEAQNLEDAVRTAEALVNSKRFDEAYKALERYRSFAPEMPRISAVVDIAFQHRRTLAQQFEEQENWDAAIMEYRRALSYKDDLATSAALGKAQSALQTMRDKAAAATAVRLSTDFATKKQFVEAYEVLEELPDAQRVFASAELDALKNDYVTDAVKRAEALSRVHLPIRGRADENGVREAFRLLQQASMMKEDETLKVKLDILGDRMSEYYVREARKMFAKPRGSGVGLGWLFLQEAQRFKSDVEGVKDEMTKQAPIYDARSKLSVGLQFRDQTSRRDSVGFADQLADAVAAGLESSGIAALNVLGRKSQMPMTEADSITGLEPNFQLLCDIVQHRIVKKVDSQRVPSHYRAGQHEVRNSTWIQAKREMDEAQAEFNSANARAALAMTQKKKLPAEVAQHLQEVTLKVADTRKKLESLPEFQMEDVILPYNYTRRTVEMLGTVEFSFRVTDATGVTPTQSTVKIELPRTFTVIENVKPEDTDGVQEVGTPPDESQVLSEVEAQAQAALIKKIAEKISELPPRILDEARRRKDLKDLEGAAERYVLYLNATPGAESKERQESQQFLESQFNVEPSQKVIAR